MHQESLHRAFKVYELDVLPIPANATTEAAISQGLMALHNGLKLVDRLVVSSSSLADALFDMHPDAGGMVAGLIEQRP
jgi:hypothetical protein